MDAAVDATLGDVKNKLAALQGGHGGRNRVPGRGQRALGNGLTADSADRNAREDAAEREPYRRSRSPILRRGGRGDGKGRGKGTQAITDGSATDVPAARGGKGADDVQPAWLRNKRRTKIGNDMICFKFQKGKCAHQADHLPFVHMCQHEDCGTGASARHSLLECPRRPAQH